MLCYIISLYIYVSVAQSVASMSGVVLGRVVEVVGSNFAGGKIFTASIGSVDSLYPSIYIYIYIYTDINKKTAVLKFFETKGFRLSPSSEFQDTLE